MLVLQDVRYFKDLTTQWLNAWKHRDQEQLEFLLAEEFLFFSTLKNKCLDKSDWLYILLACYQLDEWEVEFYNAQVYDNTAIVVYKLHVKVKPNYTGEAEKYIVTDTWSLIGDQWKFVFHEPVPV